MLKQFSKFSCTNFLSTKLNFFPYQILKICSFSKAFFSSFALDKQNHQKNYAFYQNCYGIITPDPLFPFIEKQSLLNLQEKLELQNFFGEQNPQKNFISVIKKREICTYATIDTQSWIIKGLHRAQLLEYEKIPEKQGLTKAKIQKIKLSHNNIKLDISLEMKLKYIIKLYTKFINNFLSVQDVPVPLSNYNLRDYQQIIDVTGGYLEMQQYFSSEIIYDLYSTLDIHNRVDKIIKLLQEFLQFTETYGEIGVNTLFEFLHLWQIQQKEAQKNIDFKRKSEFMQEVHKIVTSKVNPKQTKLSRFQLLQEKMKSKKVPPHIEKIYKEEMIRYDQYHESSVEANNIYTYLEWITNLPFDQGSEEVFDLDKAKKVLDENHYAMDEMKDRILEYIAVGKIAKSFPGKILCLVGPPGVGKTTFAESIAKALGRKFFRISMGGEHDSAFLKGHRKTYIGSYPGKIIQGLKETQANNCVILIDEIDKIGRERLSGDLQSTLLEILDPVQNNEFTDNYLDFPVDVSKVVFICCANSIEPLSQPLADRMEVTLNIRFNLCLKIITIPSYTNPEKLAIAENYLLPKLFSSSCIEPYEFNISKELLEFIIESYCRDPGVRSLEKQLQKLFQKGAYEIVTEKKKKQNLTKQDIITYLGPQHHQGLKIEADFLPVGISTGLAYTGNGGCILYIEAQQLPNKSPLILTGNLGKVMQESIEIASSVCGGNISLHVNAMSGAISKEGPSAGIAIASAIESVKRKRQITAGIAMTGELSLRGKVLKVGGILEKVIAAKREGINEVILPEGNRDEFQELKEEVKKGMRVHFVGEFKQVIKILFPEEQDE